ncbi:HAD family hydrolase [Gaetbulibacter saemankumensis]|uniref:HAD family hydrolase n=1 Tax=Gaetbulibacter saemankumensis TaxID=311208 RepID=UPI00040AEA23|nr:HAD family phosphatase [Gaetbulibacter saemankumensis]
MIKTLIFDFGNVFINLDIEGAIAHTMKSFKIESFPEEMIAFNSLYEQGLISTNEFIEFYQANFPNTQPEELISIWNYMLKDFPEHRLDFLKKLKSEGKYKLILLSNTNELHIDWIKNNIPLYDEFKQCFDAFYLSHEIQLRKPNQDIFKFVLKENNIIPQECLFIDDNADNIQTAKSLDINTWHITPNTDDVTTLFETKLHLF